MEVRVEPTAREWQAIAALLWQELDGLRSRFGEAQIAFNQRAFTNHDLLRGHSLGLVGHVKPTGTIVAHIGS